MTDRNRKKRGRGPGYVARMAAVYAADHPEATEADIQAATGCGGSTATKARLLRDFPEAVQAVRAGRLALSPAYHLAVAGRLGPMGPTPAAPAPRDPAELVERLLREGWDLEAVGQAIDRARRLNRNVKVNDLDRIHTEEGGAEKIAGQQHDARRAGERGRGEYEAEVLNEPPPPDPGKEGGQ